MVKIKTSRFILLHFVWLVFLCLALPRCLAADGGRDTATHEYQVKAAFLYNFVKFTEWPESTFKDPKAPIHIAIIGPNRFGDAFAPFLEKSIKGRGIEISYHREFEHVGNCQVAFFSGTDRSKRDLRWFSKPLRPVLTVGESTGFSNQGGMINFVMAGKKMRFEINPVTVEQAGLKISSKLLHLAKIVGQGEQKR